MKKILKNVALIFFMAGILLPAFAFATTITLEPSTAQRKIGGKIRMHVYVNDAISLISMGVKVSFDPSVLQVVEASKYENVVDGWLMDGDGDPATTGDQYNNPAVDIDNTAGTVAMFGGHLTGTSTVGLNGKVLLGWIVFEAVGNGDSQINLDLFKYHPDDPVEKFNNFVNLDGSVDEPTNIPGQLGMICVLDDACVGDINSSGRVFYDDYALFNAAWNTQFGDENYNPACDLDGDGRIFYSDYALFNADWNKSCSSCSPPM